MSENVKAIGAQLCGLWGCTYSALWQTLWRRKFAQKAAKLFLQTPRAQLQLFFLLLSLVWQCTQATQQGSQVKNISDDAETFKSEIKVKACCASMMPYCIVLQVSAQSF